MAGANIGRSKTTPFRIEPERGQVAENVSKPSRNEPWHVFQEDELRSYFAKYSRHVWPEPSLVGLGFSLAGEADGLTREPGSDAIHFATPRATVEGSKVRPDRRLIQAFVPHARDKDRGCIGFPLDITNGSGVRHGEAQSEFETADAGTKRQDIQPQTPHAFSAASTRSLK